MPEHEQNPTSQASILNDWLSHIAWIIALSGTVGSLFFSEVMQYPPCLLCWYQRIALYPLVLIIGTGIIMRDGRMKYYAAPLCIAGLLVSMYHNLLYYGIIPETMAPCADGVPCNAIQIEMFGFVTIPLLSLLAFIILTLCLTFHRPKNEINRI